MAVQQEVGVGLGVLEAPHPATKLVELGRPEAVGALDDQRVAIGYIQAAFDDGRAHEHVVAARNEFGHCALESVRAHLPVAHAKGGLGKNVDGVAIVNFLETVSMFEGDKVKGVSDELLDLIESKRFSKLLLNLSNAHFVSSAMLAHLVKLNRKMQEIKGKIRLCCLRPVIQDAFKVSNFDKIFEIFPDEAAALKKF